ncbi:Phospholipid/glycerol acyltransferase [uncultured Paludibacter sp.]|uniref:Phospholipid/glycerol acyltransferase n=1 Tax=uncultured Paludibacter sp. TaxID=497635 RepID=A0A653AF90_9BACT|nr:Phospholipid/glycerol acyltransferase [uncultured Paludibacter sp.]
MSKIYEFPLSYNLTRRYMLFGFKRFYSEVIIKGTENLVFDEHSALIFAPNHLNALMDALSVLTLVPKNKVVVFLAKADLFDNKISAALMRFAKILPAYRMENGMENLGKNNDIFEQSIEVLENGQYIGIMPEGGQGEQHRIRPLVKGIFRIAFEAQKRFGEMKNVKIVPVGIDMGDLIKSGKHLIINVGKPIDIQKHFHDYEINPSVTTNKVKIQLRHALSDLTLDIASVHNYEIIKFLSDVEGYKFIAGKNDKNPVFSRFLHKQKFIKNLLKKEKENPAEFEKIKSDGEKLREKLNSLKLRPAVFSSEKTSVWELILGFPAFLFGFLTNFLPVFVPVWIRKVLRVEYDGFYSSIHYGLGLITFPLFYILQMIVAAKLFRLGMFLSPLFFLLEYFTRPYALRWWKKMRKFFEKRKKLNQYSILRIKRYLTFF